MTSQYIDNLTLLQLFKAVNLFKTNEYIQPEIDSYKSKRKKIEQNIDELDASHKSNKFILNMTPISKLIYDYATTTEKKRLLYDFQYDDKIIKVIDEIDQDKDKDYIYEDDQPGTIGYFLESWVVVNYKCPICNENSLHKYVISNII